MARTGKVATKQAKPACQDSSALQAALNGGNRFRRFALGLPEAMEGTHMGHADFRVNGRIFATLAYETKGRGTLKLTPEQQAEFIAELPQLFEPAPGGWGRMGMTLLQLDKSEDAVMQGALHTAYQNTVQPTEVLREAYAQEDDSCGVTEDVRALRSAYNGPAALVRHRGSRPRSGRTKGP